MTTAETCWISHCVCIRCFACADAITTCCNSICSVKAVSGWDLDIYGWLFNRSDKCGRRGPTKISWCWSSSRVVMFVIVRSLSPRCMRREAVLESQMASMLHVLVENTDSPVSCLSFGHTVNRSMLCCIGGGISEPSGTALAMRSAVSFNRSAMSRASVLECFVRWAVLSYRDDGNTCNVPDCNNAADGALQRREGGG
jgi:hypothetical protein